MLDALLAAGLAVASAVIGGFCWHVAVHRRGTPHPSPDPSPSPPSGGTYTRDPSPDEDVEYATRDSLAKLRGRVGALEDEVANLRDTVKRATRLTLHRRRARPGDVLSEEEASALLRDAVAVEDVNDKE